MRRAIRSANAASIRAAALIALALGMGTAAGCRCTDPANIDADPDCESRRDPSRIVVNVDWASIPPAGSESQLQILGNRTSTDDVCFAEGASSSFSDVVSGTAGSPQPAIVFDNLADLAWHITVNNFSAVGQVELDVPLTAGNTHTLTISANAAGELQAGL